MHYYLSNLLAFFSAPLLSTFLASALLLLSSNASSASIEYDLDKVLRNQSFHFATSDKIYCAPAKKTHSSDYPHSDYMLDVASAKNLVVFVHGFVPTRRGGHEGLDEMASDWKYHIDILDDLKADTSYCVVTWDTEYGFDDSNKTLSKFLTAYDFAARDPRLDSSTKNITMVGHSAGGNYIKYSYLSFLDEQPNIQKLTGKIQPKNLKTRIITLSTPHLGSTVADTAQMTSYLASLAASLIFGQQGANSISVLPHKANSRGAGQLKSIHLNDALYNLNRRFAKNFPKKRIYAFGSPGDSNVTYYSSAPSFTTPVKFKNMSHSEFFRPYLVNGYSDILLAIYSGKGY